MTRKNTSLSLEHIYTHLNESQKQAVMHKDGPLLVIAGAGSGKTRVITTRIAHLIIHEHVLPSAIIALTFTNKAAQEMKERIAHFLGNTQELPFVGTFHSYCLRLLKKNIELLEHPFFSIIDEDDQYKLIQSILQRNNLHKQMTARQVIHHISQLKSHHIDPVQHAHQILHPLMHRIYDAYEKEKCASKCLDFDDLLLQTYTLLNSNASFRRTFQESIRHVLVDEYQDTNVVQHELLKQMTKNNKKIMCDSICVVGDEDQSIYSWRGATITNMLNFQRDFPKTIVIKIEQNYRSVQPILDVANHVIKHNTNRNKKTLWSEKQAQDRIRVLTCLSEYQESDIIAQALVTIARKQPLGSVAIVYRTHAQSRIIEEACIKQSIPYKIIGGVQFYERKEIKDLLAYMRLVINPYDRMSLFRVINTPSRGLGTQFEEQFYALWHQEPFLTFHQIAHKLYEELPKSKKTALKQFIAIFDELAPTTTPSSVLEAIVKRTEYISYIKDAYEPQEATSRIENIKELFDALKHFESIGIQTATQFLEEVTLMQEKIAKNNKDNNNAVLLMTLHAAKGLEFDTVIITGLEEGILPASRALNDDDALEEERRLFYVGITRAKERLIVSHALYRYTYGQMTQQYPSRFLQELPQHGITRYDCSHWTHSNTKTFFSDWILLPVERTKQITEQIPVRPAIVKTKKIIPASSNFKKNQPVMHPKYGMGLVQNVEQKNDGTIQVTVKFKNEIKKIVSTYLQEI